jgi:hypothetical protein
MDRIEEKIALFDIKKNNQISLFESKQWLDFWLDKNLLKLEAKFGEVSLYVREKKIGPYRFLSNAPYTQKMGPLLKDISENFLTKQDASIHDHDFIECLRSLDNKALYAQGLYIPNRLLPKINEMGGRILLASNAFTHAEKNWRKRYAGLTKGHKSSISKSVKECVEIELIDDLDKVWNLFADTLARKNINFFGKNYEANLIDWMISINIGFLLISRIGNVIISAGFFGFDDNKIYYLMGGSNRNAGSSFAHTTLIYTAIRIADNSDRKFDFEGSMLPGVMKFNKSFGAEIETYHRLLMGSAFIKKIYALARF